MKNQQKGFTLIELLVVIVIIGILATISTATFSGYFRKARDTERQTFVRNAQQIAIAATVSQDSPDYRLGGATTAAVETAFEAALETQGYDIPATKNGISYYYIIDSADVTVGANTASDFIVFACKEDVLGTTGTAVSDVAFVAGTTDAVNAVTVANANTACAATPVAPTAESGWTSIALANG